MRSALSRRVVGLGLANGPSPSAASNAPSIQHRHQTAAPAAASNQAHFDNIPKELRFFVDFEPSEQDLHFELLEEANLKHGVFLNVPPQLPPEGSPPEVPDVIICEATMARLRTVTLAYEPTHAPPPFDTAGTRGIYDIVTQPLSTPSRSPQLPAATSAVIDAAALAGTGTERKLIEVDAKFHCSVCSKPFRVRIAAEHHITIHPKVLGAKLLDGPGEGELILDTASATPVVDAKQGGRLAAVAPESTAAPAKKVDFVTAELDLPGDMEIEDLLKDIWDTVGAKLGIKDFKESTTIVAGVADKRPPPGTEKPSFSATPAGVAPGIKRTTGKKSLPLTEGGKVMTNKEMAARLASPFGDTDLLADFDEDDSRNPFLPVEVVGTSNKVAAKDVGKDIDGGLKGKASAVTKAAAVSAPAPIRNSFDLTNSNNSQLLAKKLTCHICQQKFRLLDGLHNHYEDEHGTTMPDEVLRASLAINPTAALYEDKVPATRKDALAASSGEKAGAGTTEGNDGDDILGGSGPGGLDSTPLPVPIDEADISIHLRAHSNTLLVGDVLEVRRGFIKTHAILQIILRVTHDEERRPEREVGAPDDGKGNGRSQSEQTRDRKPEVDLITVRCYGDQFSSGPLISEIRVGTQLVVNGVLKLNRRLDKVSNRIHSFPYVLVSSPLGSIQMIE